MDREGGKNSISTINKNFHLEAELLTLLQKRATYENLSIKLE